jgi:hypothetical protein
MALQQTNIFSNIVAFTRASSATYFDSTGKLRTATTNTPRFDYNPITLALRGILVEEQRTNLVTYSEDFNNSAWSKTRSSIAANAATSPSGAFNADKLIEDTTATNTHRLSAVFAATSGTTYTFSAFLKKGEREHVRFVIGGTGIGSDIGADFNLTNGTIVADVGSPSAKSISAIGNGWYKLSVSVAASSTANINPFVYLCDTASNTIYTGDGTSGVYIWGAQLEVGTFPTSYIPSSVTFSGRTSDGTYFDSTGTLRTAGSGVARMQYDPANLSADPFLLLEESRTNSVPNNMMVGAARGTPGTAPTGWIAGVNGSGLTIQLVGTGTENGIAYVDYRFSGTTSSATEFFVQPTTGTTVAASNGQTWTGSFYVRAVAGSIANIVNARVITRGINISSALTIGTGSDVKASLNVSSINLLRPTTTVTTADAATTAVQTYFGCSHGSGVAIDITLRIGMPQLEQGTGATSVIPTSSVAVTRSADTSSSATATRSADVASINMLDPWYNAREGTIYAELQSLSPLTPAESVALNKYPEVFKFLQTGASTGILWYGTAAELFIGNVYNNLGSVLVGTVNKVAVAMAASGEQSASSLNGAAAVNRSGTNTPAPTIFALGHNGSAGASTILNGYLRRITYYPRRLTNAELQALTT